MGTVKAVYEHRSTGLVLLGLGAAVFTVGLFVHGKGGVDLLAAGMLVSVTALVRISHQVADHHVRASYRYGRWSSRRNLVSFPRREDAIR